MQGQRVSRYAIDLLYFAMICFWQKYIFFRTAIFFPPKIGHRDCNTCSPNGTESSSVNNSTEMQITLIFDDTRYRKWIFFVLVDEIILKFYPCIFEVIIIFLFRYINKFISFYYPSIILAVNFVCGKAEKYFSKINEIKWFPLVAHILLFF